MTVTLDRAEKFEESQRQKFCALVGVGVPRAQAAASVAVAPSTVTRRMASDPLFAETVLEAETACELRLLTRIMQQSERSWRAAVWLLERMRPERYARGKAQQSAPGWDEMFDKFVALIDSEVADPALRERLTQGLDAMAREQTAAAGLDHLPVAAADNDAGSPTSPTPRQAADQRAAPLPQHAQQKPGKALAVDLPVAAVPPASLIGEILNRGKPGGARHRSPDFCNTSLDVHERRLSKSVCS